MHDRQSRFGRGFGMGAIVVAAMSLLAGCATPTVVQSVQPNDGQLTCEELQKESVEAERLRGAAEGAKGAVGGNIIMGVIFFPAVLLTYENVRIATRAAEARKDHLKEIMSRKSCSFAAADPAKAKGK